MAQSNSTSRKDSNSSGEFEAKEEERRLYLEGDEPDLGGKYFAFEFGALRCAKLAASF